MREGVRLSTGLVQLTAVGNGDGIAIGATAFTLFTLPTQRAGTRAVIRKLAFRNQSGGNGNLLIGYADLTAPGAGALFVLIGAVYMINGIADFMTEAELPIFGNTPQGFQADTTPVTGTLGNIIVETDCLGAAVLTPVGVIAEIELY